MGQGQQEADVSARSRRRAIPGPVDVRFESSEPATIYYTTDGSRPTFDSPRYAATEFREPGQVFHVTETTTFHWFSVDTAGNIEQNYDP